MTAKAVYWEGWNDAAWGRPYRPDRWPREYRLDYRAGWLEYHVANGGISWTANRPGAAGRH